MRITVYGTRGSYPVCRRDVLRYGGNTTCLLLESGSTKIVIDGGTGIVRLGRELERSSERRLHLVLTHPHWDHVLGLPHFAPFYSAGVEVDVYGSDSENRILQGILSRQHNDRNFPVPFAKLPATLRMHRIVARQSFELGGVRVRTLQLNHPGIDLGYRFEDESGSFVVLTDLAPIEDNLLGAGMSDAAAGRARQFEQDYLSALCDFVRGADFVYHDTNFTAAEIEGRRHWGHSTPDDALALLGQHAAAPALILSHHDPDHSDETMDGIWAHTRRLGKERGIDVLIAAEGGSFST
jgi:phosphoribosyl 1,2-cyclic phosphodiesterase